MFHLLSIATYCIGFGFFGLIIQNRNLIMILIALELILLGLSCYFVFFSFYLPNLIGQIAALLLLTLAGAESALGLALIMVLYRLSGSIHLQQLMNLKN